LATSLLMFHLVCGMEFQWFVGDLQVFSSWTHWPSVSLSKKQPFLVVAILFFMNQIKSNSRHVGKDDP
jgi:hypothetical protein